MDVRPTQFTVLDYCKALDRREITVNPDYQRGVVWKPIAQAFLIESLILGYPVPKLSLHQKTDVPSMKTLKEIVDGHQRTFAIQRFYKDKLRLSRTLETEQIAGRKFSDLDEEHQHAFLDYGLNVDLFIAATDAEVREVFRRMNSYTVTLNPEEQRHARYQGAFKWFVHRLAKTFAEPFLQMGVFSQKQLVRMADTKLLTEICHALVNGIRTTNKGHLDSLYFSKDKDFPEENEFEDSIQDALDRILSWDLLHQTPIMRHYNIYALVLAVIHMQSPVESLTPVVESGTLAAFDDEIVMANLQELAGALEEPEEPSRFEEFVDACSGRTNVKDQREKRFRWLCTALLAEAI